MHAAEENDGEIPQFTCRLQKLEGVAPGVWTLIEQQDIARQLTELLYRKSSRAIALAVASEERVARAELRAERSEKRLAALEAFKWKVTWAGGAILTALEVALRYLPK